MEKRKVDVNFVVVFNKKIWQTAFTRYIGETVLTGFHMYFWKNCRGQNQIILIVTMSQNISHFEKLCESGKTSEITHTHGSLNIQKGTQGS